MNTVAFDTLAFAKRLQKAGVPVGQSEAHASAQADFLTHHLLSEVATKTDLKALEAATKADMKALQADLKALEAATKADMKALRADIKADLAKLETKLSKEVFRGNLVTISVLAALMALFKLIG